MSEQVKIAPNGQWSLDNSTPVRPPRVTVYRGMNGVTAKQLAKLGVTAAPEGGSASVQKQVDMKQHGWWNDNPRVAMMYAAMDPENKKPVVEPTYDVYMIGETDHPGGEKNITHAMREANSLVDVHTIAYMPTRGSTDERDTALRAQLPHVPWNQKYRG